MKSTPGAAGRAQQAVPHWPVIETGVGRVLCPSAPDEGLHPLGSPINSSSGFPGDQPVWETLEEELIQERP